MPLFVLAHFTHHLLTALPIPLLPMIRGDFSLDYKRSGFVMSAFTLSYGIGHLPAGWLADRAGPRLVLTIGICGVALAGFFVGLSETFLMMVFFLALMGVLGGGYHPAAPPMISASVEPQSLGRALGVHAIGGSASFFLSPLIAVLIASLWGWRGSFIGLALPTFVFGFFFYRILGRMAVASKEAAPARSIHPAGAARPRFARTLVPFIILSTFTSAVIYSAASFIPLFLVDHFGYSKETAGALFAFIYSGGLWMSPLSGYFSDRWGRVPVILTVCFLAGPIIFLLNWVPSGLGIIILLITIGMISYARMPVSEAYIIEQTEERNRSLILGIYFFSSSESGGLLTPVVGHLIDHFGFYYSFSIAGAAVFLVTLLCSFWLRGDRSG
jgi:MFS family permease